MPATHITAPLADYDVITAAIIATDGAMADEFVNWRGIYPSGAAARRHLTTPSSNAQEPVIGGFRDIEGERPPHRTFNRNSTPWRRGAVAFYWRMQSDPLPVDNGDRFIWVADQILKTELVAAEGAYFQFDLSIPPTIGETPDAWLEAKSLVFYFSTT